MLKSFTPSILSYPFARPYPRGSNQIIPYRFLMTPTNRIPGISSVIQQEFADSDYYLSGTSKQELIVVDLP